jgi:hypothetical protein
MRHTLRLALALFVSLGCWAGSARAGSLVGSNTVWRYFDAGFQPATNWMQPGFSDSAWLFGAAQLGFGNTNNATTLTHFPGGAPLITAYFRHQFTISDASLVTSLELKLWRDDGAIVYVNGVEVFRSNMPAVPVTYSTLAASAVSSATIPVQVTLPPGVLVNGPNVVAVEVHQVSATSSDLAFALELTSNIDLPPNNVPLGGFGSVTVAANGSVSILLAGYDADGDRLSFQALQPEHGVVTGSNASVVYTPAPGYVGADTFNYMVTDGRAVGYGAIAILVQAVNQPPVAVATASSVSNPGYQTAGLSLIAANNQNVEVILDGSGSTDPNGDALSYSWSIVGGAPFSTNGTLTRSFDVGLWSIALLVSDGIASSIAYVAVEVRTPCQALEKMKIDISAEPGLPPRDAAYLQSILDSACESFSTGRSRQGVQKLERFQKEAQRRLGKDFPFFAGDLIESAQVILDAFKQ